MMKKEIVKMIYDSYRSDRKYTKKELELKDAIIDISGGSLFQATSIDMAMYMRWQLNNSSNSLYVYHDRDTNATVMLNVVNGENKLYAAAPAQRQIKTLEKGLVERIKIEEIRSIEAKEKKLLKAKASEISRGL